MDKISSEIFVKECVGCGYCCLKGICVGGYMYHSKGEPMKLSRCPSLIWKNGRYWCERVLVEPKFWTASLDIGKGCSSPLNTWRKDIKFRG